MTMAEMPLHDLAKEIARINRANGWYNVDRSVSDELMLIVGEVAEAHEEDRKGRGPGDHYYRGPAGGLSMLSRDEDGLNKPEGIPSEMADILIRVLDFCWRYNIDIDDVVAEKLAFNATRGERHGGKRI
jgi:NTP pyrophosphatase (non-canonical NTP hydrolase)